MRSFYFNLKKKMKILALASALLMLVGSAAIPSLAVDKDPENENGSISVVPLSLTTIYVPDHYLLCKHSRATSAALFPERNIPPKIAPIRWEPKTALAAIPATIKPG